MCSVTFKRMCYQFNFLCFAGLNLNCLSDERKLIKDLPILISTETSIQTSIKALTFLKSQEPQKICPISPVGRSRPGSMFSPLSKRDKRHLASSPLCRPHVCQIFALHCVDTCRYYATYYIIRSYCVIIAILYLRLLCTLVIDDKNTAKCEKCS